FCRDGSLMLPSDVPARSSSVTVLSVAATYTASLVGSTAMATGPVPTPHVAVTLFVFGSITETVAAPEFAAYTMPLTGSTATDAGLLPTATVAVTALLPPSITATLLLSRFATYTWLLCWFSVMPTGRCRRESVMTAFTTPLVPSTTVT